MTRTRLVFGYPFGVEGGVCTQLLNRYATFAGHYDVSVLFGEDLGMVARFPAGVAEVARTPEDRAAALDRLQPDVLAVIDDPAMVRAWRDAGRPGRLVLEVHTTYRSGLSYLRGELDDVDTVVTVSRYMRGLLRELGFVGGHDPHIVPNCLDAAWFEPAPAEPTPTPVGLWVGKVDGHKRWRSALHVLDTAAVDAAAAGVDLRPLLVGGYTTADDTLAEMTARVAASPVLRRGRWLPRVDYRRMRELYDAVAAGGGVAVSTSSDESFGMSAAEALVRGCPVVAPGVGALPELLPSAALYPPGDLDAARRATVAAVLDRDFRVELLASVEQAVATLAPATALAAYRAALEPAAGPAPVQ